MEEFVCGDCGHEQDHMFPNCDKCHSTRMVTISFAEQHFGLDWRERCFGEPK